MDDGRQSPPRGDAVDLFQHEAIVRAIFDDVPDFMVLADPERRIVRVNPASMRIFGYSMADLVGQPTSVLYERFEDFEQQGRERFNPKASETTTPYVVNYRRRNGEVFPGETIGVPLRDRAGRTLGFLGIIRDVGERVQFEDSLRRLYSISSSRAMSGDEKIVAMLEVGATHFDLPLGIVSEITADEYVIKYAVCPHDEISPGQSFTLGETYCLHTLHADGPTGFHEAGTSDIRDHPCYRKFGLEAYIGAPLLVDGERYGTINFSRPTAKDKPFSSNDLEIVRMFSEWIGHEIARQRDLEALERAQAELYHRATTDELTGALNRRHFFERGADEIRRARRYRRPMSLVYFDLDHFKQINDAHGHHAGDQVLQAVSAACRSELRNVDIPGRLGGEEFAIILPETPKHQASRVAERLRQAIAAIEVQTEDTILRVTASFGLAHLAGQEDNLESILIRADRAVYQAKAEGRGRVVVAS